MSTIGSDEAAFALSTISGRAMAAASSFVNDERGQTITEYALLVALLVGAFIALNEGMKRAILDWYRVIVEFLSSPAV